MARTARTSRGSRIRSASTTDLASAEGLARFAQEQGLEDQIRSLLAPEKKLSALQRLSKGLGAFNPAEAILTGQDKGSFGAGLKEYGTNVLQGIGSAVTGKDYEGGRRYFSDVVERLGVENGIAKFGLGLAGDIFLDPSTYFGGAIARGLVKGVKAGAKGTTKVIGKVSPKTEEGLELAAEGIRDAVGKAFRYGYKSSEGASDDLLTFMTRRDRANLGLAASNLNRLGTGVLTKGQQEELALNLIAGKRAEFGIREGVKNVGKIITDSIDNNFGPLKDGVATGGSYVGARIADATGKFVPEAAVGRVDDIAQKLDRINQGAGDVFRKLVAGKRVDAEDLRVAAEKAINQFAGESAKKTALEGITDPKALAAAKQQLERSQKFGKDVGLENPYEVYFPFIKKEKLDRFMQDTKQIQVGSEGYRKQFKNLLTNDNIELDPAKAFFTRESEIVTDKMTKNFLEGFVKQHGKPLSAFQNSDEALAEGWQLLKDKGRFGKELGYISKWDSELLRNSLSPEFQSINMLAKATGFDALTSLFKRSVTGLFAPFHVRNFASGIIQNYEVLGPAALNPQNIAAGQKIAYLMGKNAPLPSGTINIAGKGSMKFKDVMKPFVDRFSGDTFYNADFLDALKNGGALKSAQKTLSKESLKETVKTVGLGSNAIPFKTARAVGQYIEHQQKATAYITALNRGDTITDALKIAEKAGFDYRALTRFESQILRRIVPFYSFTRKNLELQLKTLGENPQRINQVIKFFENTPALVNAEDMTEEEKQALPSYLKESLLVKLPDSKDGLKQYISSFGTPIEQFTQNFGSNPVLRAISQMNPLIKAPIELGIGKDSFRQRDLKTVYDAREYRDAPQVVKDLLDIKPVTKDVLDKRGGKLVKVGERTVYVANPQNLLIARSLFTSRGVSYLDQVFGNDMKGFIKLLKTTTGVKPQQYDIEQLKGINESKVKRELEDILTRYGETRQFTKTYIPK